MASLLWFIFFGVTFVFLERYDSRSIQYACKVGRVTHFFAVPAVWEQTARQLLREAERQGQKEKLLRAVRFSNGLQSVFPRLGAQVARRVLFRRVREQVLGTEPMFCISGGGFLQPQAAELMNGLGYGMHNGYGMTETGILSVELSRRAKWRLSGGVGQPLQALSGGWRIAEDGVLELRSPLLYTAMLENGVRVPRDPGAWFRTRDVFRAEGGRWYMEARQGDLIIGANGENLSPDLIEQRLALQAGTASCVLGMELEGDERPVLIVQTAADDYARARASAAAYEAVARLPLTMRPARIFLTEQELPISFGKPRRAELREKLADGSIVLTPAHRPEPEELTRLEDESSRALVQELCELLGSVTGQTVGPDTQLLQELGHDPSPEEIAAEMDMPVDKVREILKIAQEPVSLETPIGEEEDSHLGDFIPDEGASEPSEAASFTLLQEQLVDVLSTLTPREEKVLKLRFGIEDGRPRTLEEVGKEFNVTRERIRQIEAKALRKLRHPSRSKKLKDFLN